MLKVIKKFLPRRIKLCVQNLKKPYLLIGLYRKDRCRFAEFSALKNQRAERSKLLAIIAIDYHRIEKGLSLRYPRTAFGKPIVLNLLNNLDYYLEQFGSDWTCEDAFGALAVYFSKWSDHPELTDLHEHYQSLVLKRDSGTIKSGAVDQLDKSTVESVTDFDFAAFYKTRKSIRQFSGENVPVSTIESAIDLAKYAPSVCNRQPWKVHCLTNKSEIQRVCEIQGGSRPFKDEVDKLLVVCADLSQFYSIGERNECWVDGGIFLQSLLVCLHAQNVGACPLNWCVNEVVDEETRRIVEVPNNEVIIAIVAVGQLQDSTTVARASRKPVSQILTVR